MSRRPWIPSCKTWWCCIDPVDHLVYLTWANPRPPLRRTRSALTLVIHISTSYLVFSFLLETQAITVILRYLYTAKAAQKPNLKQHKTTKMCIYTDHLMLFWSGINAFTQDIKLCENVFFKISTILKRVNKKNTYKWNYVKHIINKNTKF